MSSPESVTSPITVQAENIGGIDTTEVLLQPGVNVLTGRNATNRTSFLQTIMAALGSRRSSLKGDADAGHVELTFDDEQYTRYLERRNGEIVFDGDPYLDDPELADLFAFLLESNEARRAVRRGDDLRELIMRPIDTDEIEAEIEALEAEKRELDDRLEELSRLDTELPDLEEERVTLESEIAATNERIAELENELDDFDLDVDASRARKAEIESAFADLQDARTELESIEYDLETERESYAELERERDELEAELEAFDDPQESPDRLEGRVQELRSRKRSLDTTVSELQSVIRFNEERLADGGLDLEASAESSDDDDITEQLLTESTDVVCWTCGSQVERDRIESTLDRLRSLRQEKLDERSDLQERIDELSDRRKELRQQAQNRGQIETRLAAIDDELERRATRIDELEAELDDQQERVDELESDAETFENAEYGDVIETHRELNRLELEREDLEDERDEVQARIDEIDGRIEERSELEDRRGTVEDELTDLRTRVDRIEETAVDAFNEHMDSILSILEYRNIDRIWIERREKTVREGRRKVTRTAFDLHIVRTTEEGRTYEDTVDHLSESEREVTGLVFALAGYLVHDVHEVVPFMLLDSLEAIDSNRIADLVDYFEEYVDCLVVALLREDAEALSDAYTYVQEI
ncbi:archaea-specific SMC-related protein [Natrinema ejinorense]|uniref:Chromosome segregation protein SMC n=1 Tax=Natrinema ejinorense TaxID=373386 RepID=A0A2A5QT28_9EURY|nr:archaea-specific SMC-related protein [Natrinema ejinorense]PCR89972.1 chromosome segregation protein SMC [Natrinema ejinorense]